MELFQTGFTSQGKQDLGLLLLSLLLWLMASLKGDFSLERAFSPIDQGDGPGLVVFLCTEVKKSFSYK